jgi:hypothetical protein
MWPPFCLTTSCKQTLAFVTTFRWKKAIFLFRNTFSNQSFITLEFIQPFSFPLIMTSLELQPFGTVFLFENHHRCYFLTICSYTKNNSKVWPFMACCSNWNLFCCLQIHSPRTNGHTKSQGTVLPNSMQKGKNLERLISASSQACTYLGITPVPSVSNGLYFLTLLLVRH